MTNNLETIAIELVIIEFYSITRKKLFLCLKLDIDGIFTYDPIPLLHFAVLFGGASVVAITLIAKYLNPKYTGIVYALPIILIVAMIFVYLGQGLEASKATLKSTFVYEFTLVYFILAFYLLLQKMDFWWAMGIALLSWVIIASLIQLFLHS